jgi:hypothetical protein
MRVRNGTKWVELPKPEVLQTLADETYRMVEEMNHERLRPAVSTSSRTAAGSIRCSDSA